MRTGLWAKEVAQITNYFDDVIANQEYKIRTSMNVRMTSGLPESVIVFLP